MGVFGAVIYLFHDLFLIGFIVSEVTARSVFVMTGGSIRNIILM